MKIFKRPLLLLFFVVLIGTLVRLYMLGQVPASLNWDEVALGYNAKSILVTGEDEYGDFLPFVLRSYDDYKPALYAFTAIPVVAVLGLTEVAVRLPSALFGIGAIIIVYFLVLELLGKREVLILGKQISSSAIALATSFFLAISPWHIQFSRIAFESNLGLTINLASLLLFLKGLKKPWLLIFSFSLAAANMHVYQSDRVFTPLLFICLTLIFFKKLWSTKKFFFASLFCAFLIALPFILYMFTNQNALQRARGVSIFSDSKIVERSAEKLIRDKSDDNYIGLLFDNRRIEFIRGTALGYISHFDLNWLFITGDIARHHAPDMGLMYLFELPLLFIGIYTLVFLPIDRKHKLLFFVYFLLVPVPASITSGVPHAVRTLNFLWTFQLFVALGFIVSIIFVQNLKDFRKILATILIIGYGGFIALNISYYLNQYFVQTNYFTSKDWLFGYKEAISFIKPIRSNYKTIIVENEVPFDQSYMFFLFYLDIDPFYYQKIGGTNSGGFREMHRGFYNFVFQPISEAMEKNTLLIGEKSDMPKNAKILKEIKHPDGSSAVTIGEIN